MVTIIDPILNTLRDLFSHFQNSLSSKEHFFTYIVFNNDLLDVLRLLIML